MNNDNNNAPSSPVERFDYDAFISYSRKDDLVAGALEQALTRYRPPADSGLPPRYLRVFRDKSGFRGNEYTQAVRAHLIASKKLVVVCSPDARKSAFVNEEVRIFATERGAEHIVTILWRGLPNNEVSPDTQEQAAFPAAVIEALPTPLAVELRNCPPSPRKIRSFDESRSWYLLLANLYDAKREEIEQRELKRQKRNRAYWIGGLSTVAAALAALAIWALFSAAEARRQGRISRAGELVLQSRTTAGMQIEVAERRAVLAAEAVARLTENGVARADANSALADALAALPLRVLSFGSNAATPVYAFSPDGLTLFYARGKKLQRWHLGTSKLEKEIELGADVAALTVGAHPKQIGVLDTAGNFSLWTFSQTVATREVEPLSRVSCAAIDNEHSRVAFVLSPKEGARPELQVRELPGFGVIHRIQLPDTASVAGSTDAMQPCLEFSPAGARPEVLLARLIYSRAPEEPVSGALTVRLPSNDKYSFGQPDKGATVPRGDTLIPLSAPAGSRDRERIDRRMRRAVSKVISPQFMPASLDDDLGLDDLSRIQVRIEVRDEFGIEVPDTELDALNTLGEWIAWLEAERFRWRHQLYVREWRNGEQLSFATDPYSLVDGGGRLAVIDAEDWGIRVKGAAPGAVSPTGTRYVTFSSLGEDPYVPLLKAGTLEVWNTGDGAKRAQLPGGGDFYRFSRDGQSLFTVNQALVRAWSVDTGSEGFRINARQPVRALVQSAGGRYIALSAEDNSLDIWSVGHPQERMRVPANSLAQLSPDGKRLAVASSRWVWTVDPQTGTSLAAIPVEEEPTQLRWSHDSRYLVVHSRPQLFDAVDPAKPVKRHTTLFDTSADARPVWTAEAVQDVAISPNNTSFAVIIGNELTMHALADGKPIWQVSRPKLGTLSFSGDGSRLLAVVRNPDVNSREVPPATLLIQAADGAILQTYAGEHEALAIDREGKRLALVPGKASVLFYDGTPGKAPVELKPPATFADPFGLSFGASNRLTMLTGTRAGTFLGGHFNVAEAAIVWDLTTQKAVSQLPPSERESDSDYSRFLVEEQQMHMTDTILSDGGGYVGATVFPSLVAYWQMSSAFVRGYGTVWDVTQTRPREMFRLAGAKVKMIAADGSLALLETDGAVGVWTLRANSVASDVCARLRVATTEAQWSTLLDGERPSLQCPKAAADPNYYARASSY